MLMTRNTIIFLVFGLFLLKTTTTYAQKSIRAKGEYVVLIEKTETEAEAIRKAADGAKVAAIESVFGSVIRQGNTMYVKNSQTGITTKSDMAFYSISNISVNGEWVKTIKEEYSSYTDKNGRWIKYNIEGEVRQLKSIPFNPVLFAASCSNQKCSTEVFNINQNLYIYFKAPNDGYLSIYIDDGTTSSKLLPYSQQTNASTYRVKGDKEYYFFDPTKDKVADEIVTTTAQAIEMDRIFILYSEAEFGKPVMNEAVKEEKTGYILPKAMESEDFQKWLQELRSYNKSIQLKIIDLTIKGK